ncbi:hypothetical protein E8E15_005731 [Penicillium rubens]|jgi:hypothetical protein|nr:hypothetical protein E8E15_005731 [Penicillium rubens]KAJ5046099.1 hypothetical protein NUH16_002924 [Penicillium rubens]
MSANIHKTPHRPATLPETISSQSQCPNKRDEMTIAQKCLWVDRVRSKLLEEDSNPEPGLRILIGHANLLDTLTSIPEDHKCLMNERLKPDIDALIKDTTCNEHDYDRDTASGSHKKLNIYGGNNSHDDDSDGEFKISSEYDSKSDPGLSWSNPESDSSSDSDYDWPEIYGNVEAALSRLTIVGSGNRE